MLIQQVLLGLWTCNERRIENATLDGPLQSNPELDPELIQPMVLLLILVIQIVYH
jgi:hypothetical protein